MVKKSIIILLLLLGLFSCHNDNSLENKTKKQQIQEAPAMTNPWCIDLKEWRKEYLPIDSMYIFDDNGEIEFTGQQLDFTKSRNLKVKFPQIELSAKTSISEISPLFPNSVKLNRRAGYGWGGTVSIFTHKGEVDRSFWILDFKRETLEKMTYYDYYSQF
ncbi:MAG: hypothetical protein AAF840_01255 [Bacteroidota bacterium]